ncbi:MAG: hypothetical protein JJ900_14505 [Rhodospirillales bacterium]|nr:hypothetical protein [Rhodospirillales bacterium]MBO6788055.1 hypothetical protein [Rhodospirillales bacterium]
MLRALFLALTLLWIATDVSASVSTGKEAVAEVRSGYNDLEKAVLDEMSARADLIYARLAAFFGRDLPTPIIIHFDDRYEVSTSYPHINTIGFPRYAAERNIAVLAHEMTHLFMPERRSVLLSEGIAIYAQDRFGVVIGFPNYGTDVDKLLMRRLGGIDGLRRYRLEAVPHAIFGRAGNRNRQTAYIAAGSFTRFLFEQVLKQDMAAFRRIYTTGDYRRETGKTLADLQADWWRHLGLETEPPPL